METGLLLGGIYVLLGAVCGGSFGLPSKFAKEDTPWEVLWGPFFFIATILIPCTVAPLVVNDLGGIYSRVDTETIVYVLVFGFLWGLGSMTLGMSFAFIGLSLAYALNYGAQIMFGSMMPMAIFHSDQFLTSHGYVILGGIAVCLLGVVVCGRAGILKDRSLKKDSPSNQTAETASAVKKPRMLIGLIVAVISGVLCACYAVSFEYAKPIGEKATQEVKIGNNTARNGDPADAEASNKQKLQPLNPDWAASWAVTAMILWGGALSACGYCVFQLTKNKTWGHFTKPGFGLVLLLAAAMAVLHDAAIFFFGLGCISLGTALAVSAGYPAFMSLAIIVGNLHGFRTGEWKGASRESINWIVAGIALLIVGVCVLGLGNSMMP